MNLIVAETFYSLQCEGRSIGTPAVFLRLGGCNLLCKWCDTVEVWKKGQSTRFADVLCNEYILRLIHGAHLVITGGEPLLHQDKILEYLIWLHKTYELLPFVEIETNGTILPKRELWSWVNYWNVSPKLKNSGEPAGKRINEVVLKAFNECPSATIFKFVLDKSDDVLEIFQDFDFIDMKKVWLMPAGSSQEELESKRLSIVETARDLGLNYSDRLHIVIWNKKTGV
jgi:7-carboxy-7-deazaguanine synthase